VVILVCVLGLLGVSTIHAKEPDPRADVLGEEVHSLGWIVYSARSVRGDWDLFLMRPDGSSIRNITRTPEHNEAAPRFSPDGTRLLYRRLAKEEELDHDRYGFAGEVMISDANGANPRPVGGPGELPWASWSPDGEQLASLAPQGIEIHDLRTGRITRRLARHGIYQQLCWSPDGRWLCGVSNCSGELWTVVRVSVETEEVNAVNSHQNCTPDWFPDSRRLLFSFRPPSRDGYGWTQLWAADGDGENLGLLYGRVGRHIYGGVASPDGRYVVFTSCGRDGGGAEREGAPMHLMRVVDAPMIQGRSSELREQVGAASDGPVLSLPGGWEPHWTFSEIPAEVGG